MPTWTENMMADLCELVGTTWAEVGVILRTTEMAAIPWENLVRDGLEGVGVLEPPFVVVACGRFDDWPDYQPLEGGMYKVPVVVFYIARKTSAPKQEEALEVKLSALGQALRANTYDTFMVPGQPVYDVSDANPANQVFIGMGNHPLLAGSVSVDILAGEVASA